MKNNRTKSLEERITVLLVRISTVQSEITELRNQQQLLIRLRDISRAVGK
jgi:hypothetical protein